jgi:iron complex outermembrane recepter protein
MNCNRSAAARALWTSAVSFCLLGPVFAAYADDTAAPELQEVIVTAQKREQRLQDVPVVDNVLSGDALRASSVTEVNELSNTVPGIVINSDQTGRNTQIKIRGVGPDESSNIRPSIGFFYDEIPLLNLTQGGQSVASDLDLTDMARVEVLKGPQSTLLGESVSGGAIEFYNNRPTIGGPFSGRVSGTLGTQPLDQLNAAFDIPLGSQLAARISGYSNQSTGQVLNTIDDNGHRKLESQGYAIQLAYQPISDLKFVVEHNERDTHYHGGTTDDMEAVAYGAPTIAAAAATGVSLTPANPFDRDAQMTYPAAEDMINQLTSLHATWKLNNNWSMTSITGYQTDRDHYGGNGLLGGYNASDSVITGFWAFGQQRVDYTTEEFRVNYSGEHLDSMLGVFYSSYQVPDSLGNFGFIYPTFVYPLAQVQTFDTHQRSIFSHNSYKFTDAWEVVFGARYTKEVSQGLNSLADGVGAYSGEPLDTSGLPIRHSDDSAWGGTLKLLRHLNDQVTAYAGVDRGFTLGGINNLGQPNYATEVALNYEMGLKGFFFDRTVMINADVYHTKFNGYQVVAYDSAVLSFITQNADVTSEGAELEAEWAPISQLKIGANIAYNDAKFNSYVGAECDNYQLAFGTCPNDPVAGAQNLSGKPLNQAPHWSTNLYSQYGAAIANGSNVAWFVRGEFVFRGATVAHPVGNGGDPLQAIPEYSLLNASAGLSSTQGWEVSLWGKNLTNKNYFTQILREPVGSEPDYVVARIGMERTGGITVSYHF